MDSVFSQTGISGSCFKQRLENGKCVGLLVRVNTQTECCARGGYFLNRMLTQREYLNDHLIFELGTPNCVDACTEAGINIAAELSGGVAVQKPTCEGYYCPEGYFCRLVSGQPSCHCHPQCELTDYLSGPICTSNLRRFTDRCQLKKTYCDSPNQVFEIVPCPNAEELFCSRSSRLVDAGQVASWIDNGASTWSERQRCRRPTWLLRRLIEIRKRGGSLWLGEDQLPLERQGATPHRTDAIA
ncbi:unnamed protein product [Echinostoma caproni]|uniref:EGF-like domain-containing protein n=1 Tax=Echinostoma caproni TaxID=27848 RepID=A0A183AVK0_9TREM|nr:unnamed protein product [Echinostoma caproni]